MYIHNTLSQNPINPNIVSGADLDKNYSRFEGDTDELMRIHKTIQQQLGEVVSFKSRLIQLNTNFNNLVLVDNWTPLIYQRNNGTLANTHDLHIRIEEARKEKDNARMQYSKLQGEISRTQNEIRRREQGSIFGLKQQFEDISGEEYKGVYNPTKNEYLENDNTVIDNNSINEEIEAELENGNIVSENPVVIGVPPIFPNTDKKLNLIDKISEMVGVSKQNTKYGLIGLGVVAVVVIIKNK